VFVRMRGKSSRTLKSHIVYTSAWPHLKIRMYTFSLYIPLPF